MTIGERAMMSHYADPSCSAVSFSQLVWKVMPKAHLRAVWVEKSFHWKSFEHLYGESESM